MGVAIAKWNLINPSREISKLDYSNGTSFIELKMVPGIGVILLFAFVIFLAGVGGILGFVPGLSSLLMDSYSFHPFLAFLATVPVFLIFGFMGLYFFSLSMQYLRGTETIEITRTTVKYTDKSRPKLNQTGIIKSFRNLSVRDELGTKYLLERNGLVGELSGRNIEFGVGLSERDAVRVLAFITTNHPDIH